MLAHKIVLGRPIESLTHISLLSRSLVFLVSKITNTKCIIPQALLYLKLYSHIMLMDSAHGKMRLSYTEIDIDMRGDMI